MRYEFETKILYYHAFIIIHNHWYKIIIGNSLQKTRRIAKGITLFHACLSQYHVSDFLPTYVIFSNDTIGRELNYELVANLIII